MHLLLQLTINAAPPLRWQLSHFTAVEVRR